jgi:hypothetical protein
MIQTKFDFSGYIAERTHNFTGRQWVFAEIKKWLANPDAPRYFIITGEPRIGKTAIAARLTQIRDLAAIHFCIARDANTIDPLSFARSISGQLRSIDGFAKSILEEIGIHLKANIFVQKNYGPIIAQQIENIFVESNSASFEFNRTVIEPLKKLYKEAFNKQLVILVDALDEAVQSLGSENIVDLIANIKRKLYKEAFNKQLVILVDALDEAVQCQGSENIVDLIANAKGLPSQVRFILTSRPESNALRHFEQQNIPHFVLNAGGKRTSMILRNIYEVD